jgi:hypothetical protein
MGSGLDESIPLHISSMTGSLPVHLVLRQKPLALVQCVGIVAENLIQRSRVGDGSGSRTALSPEHLVCISHDSTKGVEAFSEASDIASEFRILFG